MTIQNPRISRPHPHRSGHRCEIKDPTGRWVHGPTRPTEEEAVETAAQRLQELDAAAVPAQQGRPKDPDPPAALDPPEADKPRGAPEGVRLQGPHKIFAGWRYRIISSAGRTWAPTGKTTVEALRLAERFAATVTEQGSITIADSLDAFIQSKKKAGLRPASLDGLQQAVEAYFRGSIDQQVCRLTPHRAQQQYDRLQTETSVATHRAYLSRVKSWGRWVASKGWIRSSPVEGIRGVGKRRRGKAQLSWDEGLRLGATCLMEESEAGAAVLMAMLMGLRASEALSRVVRDLDRGGTHLRVDDNDDVAFRLKTDSSRRPVKIPEMLQPLLAKLAAGKGPTDPLFPGSLAGRKRRQWLNVECRRLCEKAAVPVVCPHSLRGWMASSAVAAGELPEVVAKGIGHASAQMTLAHYVAPGVAEAAQLARGQAAFAAALPALPS